MSRRARSWTVVAALLGVSMLGGCGPKRGDELGEEWKETQDEIRADEQEHELDELERGLEAERAAGVGDPPCCRPLRASAP